MTKQQKPTLGKRYNKDGSVSLLGFKDRVVFRSNDPRSIKSFEEGWFDGEAPRYRRARFFKEAEAA